jgi:DNA invertase Pin-like site-specific DNA recombinase
MLIGYARVSTIEQSLDLQMDALQQAGCEQIYHDKVSGARSGKPGLDSALSHLRAGDTLVVWKLDRLDRRTTKLLQFVDELEKRGISFKSLSDGLDTSTPNGKYLFYFKSMFAEMERDLNRERTMAGLTAARARGRNGGRPRKLSPAQVKAAAAMLRDPETSIDEICRGFQISRNTLYRRVNEMEGKDVDA